MEALHVLRNIEENPNSIAEHAYALNLLGEHLAIFSMRHEASIAYTSSVKLYRALNNLDPSYFSPYLSESLLNLRNHIAPEALPTSLTEEAIAILRAVVGPNSHEDHSCILADSLCSHASSLFLFSDLHEEGLRFVNEALEIYASFLPEQILRMGGSNLGKRIDQPSKRSENTPLEDFELRGKGAYIYCYISALSTASAITGRLRLYDESKRFRLKALKYSRYLASIYPDTTLEVNLAQQLHAFARLPYSILSEHEALSHNEEAIFIIDKACNYDPVVYTSLRLYCIILKIRNLHSLGRCEEAQRSLLGVFEVDMGVVYGRIDVAHALAGASMAARDLLLRSQAITLRLRSVEIYHTIHLQPKLDIANSYMTLVEDYAVVGQYEHALDAASNAFQFFQALEFENPSQHVQSLANSFLSWIEIFLILGSTDHSPISVAITNIYDQYKRLMQDSPLHSSSYYEFMNIIAAGMGKHRFAPL